MEELPEMRELHEMDKCCLSILQSVLAGGGEVLVMKQERDSNTLIVTEGGNLISKFITPQYCKFFNDFFIDWAARKCPASEIVKKL